MKLRNFFFLFFLFLVIPFSLAEDYYFDLKGGNYYFDDLTKISQATVDYNNYTLVDALFTNGIDSVSVISFRDAIGVGNTQSHFNQSGWYMNFSAFTGNEPFISGLFKFNDTYIFNSSTVINFKAYSQKEASNSKEYPSSGNLTMYYNGAESCNSTNLAITQGTCTNNTCYEDRIRFVHLTSDCYVDAISWSIMLDGNGDYVQYDHFNLTNTLALGWLYGQNKLPVCNISVDSPTKCAEINGKADFDLNISCIDLEGDTIYYSLVEKSFDVGIYWYTFSQMFEDPFNSFNQNVMVNRYENQTYDPMWDNNVGVSHFIHENSDYGGTLLLNYDWFPNNLIEKRKGMTWNIYNKVENQQPDTYFSLLMGTDSTFNITMQDSSFKEYISYQFKSMTTNEFNISVLGVEINYNLSESEWNNFKIKQDGQNISLYLCTDLECSSETLINKTILSTNTNYMRLFNIISERSVVMFDNIVFSYKDVMLPDFSTVKPSTISQEIGTFRHKIYYSDEIHYPTIYNYTTLYLTVENYDGCTTPSNQTGILDIVDKSVGNSLQNLLKTLDIYELGKTALWLIYLVLIITFAIGSYKVKGTPNIVIANLFSSMGCILISFLAGYIMLLVAFGVLAMLSLGLILSRDVSI